MPDEDGEVHSIVLRVTEAALSDVDTGSVRIDPYLLAQIRTHPGTAVTLKGQRTTVAIAEALPRNQHGLRAVQMDGMVRQNARAAVDEQVTVSRVETFPARTLLLAPIEPGRFGPEEIEAIRASLTGRAVMYGDLVKVTAFSKQGHFLRVAGTDPEAAVIVGPFTDVRIQKDAAAVLTSGPTYKVKYEDIGGLAEELGRVRELVELPLKYPALFARLRIEPPKGVLLYGPPGSGKTLIARAVASEVNANFIAVDAPEIIHKFYGESEARLREIFEEAQRRAPSIIFFDELDAIAPKRIDVAGEVEKRVVAQLLALMDGLVRRGEVVVIGASNIPEAIDPALRRPGRFDREIAVSVPTRAARLQILQIHSRGMPLADDVDLEHLADVTHGFVGADLEALCKEAGMLAVRDTLLGLESELVDHDALAERTMLEAHHFHRALKAIEPTATREFFLEKPDKSWEDAAGLEHVRAAFTSCLGLPKRFSALFEQVGVRPPSGFLLAGPSGTGKTLSAKALANELGLRLITVDPAALFSKWVGETEKALRQVFKKAKQAAPCVLLFDGLEALVPARRGRGDLDSGSTERLATQFFAELDGLATIGDVILLGATNRPEFVDPALIRAGRLGFVIHFQLPDLDQREQILRVHLRRVPLDDVDLVELACELEGFSGADIAGLCQRAVVMEIERLAEGLPDDDDPGRLIERFRLTPDSLRCALESSTVAFGALCEERGERSVAKLPGV